MTNDTIAHAIRYMQIGILLRLWYWLWPEKLTLDKLSDSLNDHMFCLGTSGSGKSRYITALTIAHIRAGHNVILIDVSDTWRQILFYGIQEGVDPKRFVIHDATRKDIPVPDHHVFAKHPGVSEDAVVDGFLAAQRGFLGDSFGERQADVLRMMAYVFVRANAPFLPWATRFLLEEKIRNAILKRANDKELSDFWQHMTSMSGYATIIESSRNKLNALAMNSLVRPYFDSNQPTIDLYEAFKEGEKIVILNLSENHYKDRSSRALVGALFLFLVYQALLRREHDPDELKKPVAILGDEAHLYYTSEFVLPYYTGSRKFNAAIKLFSQSCNNFPSNDIDIFLATAGHLVAFGIGHRDAQRIVHDLVMPQDAHMVRNVEGTDLFGTYGQSSHYSIGDQTQHAIAELMNQGSRKFFWRVRSEQQTDLYLAETAYVPTYSATPDEETAYRLESSRHHAKIEEATI